MCLLVIEIHRCRELLKSISKIQRLSVNPESQYTAETVQYNEKRTEILHLHKVEHATSRELLLSDSDYQQKHAISNRCGTITIQQCTTMSKLPSLFKFFQRISEGSTKISYLLSFLSSYIKDMHNHDFEDHKMKALRLTSQNGP